MQEIIAHIAVAHNDIFSVSGLYSADKSVAVAPVRYVYDTSAGFFSKHRRIIGASVVGNKHLAANAAFFKELLCKLNALHHGLLLVKTGHKYCQLNLSHAFSLLLRWIFSFSDGTPANTRSPQTVLI